MQVLKKKNLFGYGLYNDLQRNKVHPKFIVAAVMSDIKNETWNKYNDIVAAIFWEQTTKPDLGNN